MSGLSVVIPNRDGGALLERCLEALAAAERVHEVIVVDDGSRDGSPERASELGAQLSRSPGRGFAAAVNHGVSRARGEHVLILNSDAFVEPGTPRRLAEALDRHPELALVGGGLVDALGARTRSHGHDLKLVRALGLSLHLSTPPPPEHGQLQPVAFVPLACAAVRRSAYTAVDGLDERFHFYFEDHDLCWRLRRAGWTVAVRWDARALHEGGGSSRAHGAAPWMRQFHESRLRYVRKRYPLLWPAYLTVSVPSLLAHAALWLARALRSAAGGDRAGTARDRAWAAAYLRAALAGAR